MQPAPISKVIHSQHVETRYVEADGTRFTDIRPLEELPALVESVERDGGRLVGVRQVTSSELLREP